MRGPESRALVAAGRCLVFLAILAGAEVGVRQGLLSPIFFSSPSQVAASFLAHLRDGSILRHTWVTLSETILGFGAGALSGTALALLLSQLRFVARLLEPLLMVLHGSPVIVIAPLFILWLGIGMASKIGIGLYIVFFAFFVPVSAGAITQDPELLDALRAMGAARGQLFRKVVLPSALPSIYAGLKLGIGLALVGAVIGEFIASRAGLGHMILYASGTLDTPSLYLGIAILALFAVVLNASVNALGRILVRWRFADEK